MLFRINSNHLCLHNFGEESCSVTMPRPFKFQTGRADCVEVDLALKSTNIQYTLLHLTIFFLRETPSLDTRRRRRRFTQILLEMAGPLSSSSVTPLPWLAGRCCLIVLSILQEGDWNYFSTKLEKDYSRWWPWWVHIPSASRTLQSACSPTHGPGLSLWMKHRNMESNLKRI